MVMRSTAPDGRTTLRCRGKTDSSAPLPPLGDRMACDPPPTGPGLTESLENRYDPPQIPGSSGNSRFIGVPKNLNGRGGWWRAQDDVDEDAPFYEDAISGFRGIAGARCCGSVERIGAVAQPRNDAFLEVFPRCANLRLDGVRRPLK